MAAPVLHGAPSASPPDHTFAQMFLFLETTADDDDSRGARERDRETGDDSSNNRTCTARNHRGMIGRSRLLPENIMHSLLANSVAGQQYQHKPITTIRRVTLFQWDITLAIQTFVRYLTETGDAILRFLADFRISDEFVQCLSYFSLSLHLFCNFSHLTNAIVSLCVNNDTTTATFILPIDWFLSIRVLFGIIPAIVFISSLSLVVALIYKFDPSQAFVLMSLVALFLMECLVPITLTATCALYLLQALSAPNATAITALVWLASWAGSGLLRRVIYPSLGLD